MTSGADIGALLGGGGSILMVAVKGPPYVEVLVRFPGIAPDLARQQLAWALKEALAKTELEDAALKGGG